jgi:hypothetical protein
MCDGSQQTRTVQRNRTCRTTWRENSKLHVEAKLKAQWHDEFNMAMEDNLVANSDKERAISKEKR